MTTEAHEPDDFGPRASPMLSAPDCDLLSGLKMIAAHHGITVSQARQHVADGVIPVFKVKGRCTIFALKSACNARAAELASKYHVVGSNGLGNPTHARSPA